MDKQSFKMKRSSSISLKEEKAKQDIKTSLEQQKQANKQKFEEPFFIKIGGGGGEEDNMKIVK